MEEEQADDNLDEQRADLVEWRAHPVTRSQAKAISERAQRSYDELLEFGLMSSDTRMRAVAAECALLLGLNQIMGGADVRAKTVY